MYSYLNPSFFFENQNSKIESKDLKRKKKELFLKIELSNTEFITIKNRAFRKNDIINIFDEFQTNLNYHNLILSTKELHKFLISEEVGSYNYVTMSKEIQNNSEFLNFLKPFFNSIFFTNVKNLYKSAHIIDVFRYIKRFENIRQELPQELFINAKFELYNIIRKDINQTLHKYSKKSPLEMMMEKEEFVKDYSLEKMEIINEIINDHELLTYYLEKFSKLISILIDKCNGDFREFHSRINNHIYKILLYVKRFNPEHKLLVNLDYFRAIYSRPDYSRNRESSEKNNWVPFFFLFKIIILVTIISNKSNHQKSFKQKQYEYYKNIYSKKPKTKLLTKKYDKINNILNIEILSASYSLTSIPKNYYSYHKLINNYLPKNTSVIVKLKIYTSDKSNHYDLETELVKKGKKWSQSVKLVKSNPTYSRSFKVNYAVKLKELILGKYVIPHNLNSGIKKGESFSLFIYKNGIKYSAKILRNKTKETFYIHNYNLEKSYNHSNSIEDEVRSLIKDIMTLEYSDCNYTKKNFENLALLFGRKKPLAFNYFTNRQKPVYNVKLGKHDYYFEFARNVNDLNRILILKNSNNIESAVLDLTVENNPELRKMISEEIFMRAVPVKSN